MSIKKFVSIVFCIVGILIALVRFKWGLVPFFNLYEMLERRVLLINTKHMSVRKQVLMFLHLVGHNVRFRGIGGRFFCCTWIIHSYFRTFLGVILKLSFDLVNPSSCSSPHKISNDSRFYSWFWDCIGALDGAHCNVPVINHP